LIASSSILIRAGFRAAHAWRAREKPEEGATMPRCRLPDVA
jgi:hypothetical protein